MIISEKQIMQLITIANGSMQIILKCDMLEDAQAIANIIDNINRQQSEELKEVK